MDRIGSYSFEEYLKMVEAFHGSRSPGLILGGIMVDYALSAIPKGILYDAICETMPCLPDAIQLLTPCSFGNGWLRVLNLGRYALSLYDKYTGKGVRVFVDPSKLQDWTEIKNWFYKLKSKSEQDQDRLNAEIEAAGRSILGMHPVTVKPEYIGKISRGAIADCPACGEPYPARDGSLCHACQGQSPYSENNK